MARKDSEFQYKVMSRSYRGKGIFRPLNTGIIDERVRCVREMCANIFFYTKGAQTIMIDAGYNYPRLAEKMGWIDVDPASISDILITHCDTDHVGALEDDSELLFKDATIYLSEIENRYLSGKPRRKVYFGSYRLPIPQIHNQRVLLQDGQLLQLGDIKGECLLVPGHTWGHMVYLVDDAYLFTGDTIAINCDGGYAFNNGLAESNKVSVRSLAKLEGFLRGRGIEPLIVTGHTGTTRNLDFAFAHTDKPRNVFRKCRPYPADAPYDSFDESDDTEAGARAGVLPTQG